MKIIRYLDPKGELGFGQLNEDGDPLCIAKKEEGGGFAPTEKSAQVAKLLTPVDFRCIYCVGINYREHAAESGANVPDYPVIFMKAPTAAQDPWSPIVLPRHLRSDKVDFEGELAVVIGRPCKNVSRGEALDHVLGYTCANDVSARDWQKEKGGGQFCRGKTFDTFCPLGPCLVTTYLVIGVVCGVLLVLVLILVALRRRVMRVGNKLKAMASSSSASTLMDYSLTDARDKDSNHCAFHNAQPRTQSRFTGRRCFCGRATLASPAQASQQRDAGARRPQCRPKRQQ